MFAALIAIFQAVPTAAKLFEAILGLFERFAQAYRQAQAAERLARKDADVDAGIDAALRVFAAQSDGQAGKQPPSDGPA